MNRPLEHLNTKVSRRQVMVGAAGLSFAIGFGAAPRNGAGKRPHRQGAQPVGKHRARWHDLDHVGGDRNGAGVDDLAAADSCRGTRCRLVQSQDRDRAGDRGDLRQSGLSRHDVHCGLQRGDQLLYAIAYVRRAGAPSVARQRGEDVGACLPTSLPPSRAQWCTRNPAGV